VQFQDYRTSDSAVEICGVKSGHQMLDQQLARPEEVAEDRGTILDALEALERARQYMSRMIKRTVFLKCSTNLEMNCVTES
jgi:hypothetical protein